MKRRILSLLLVLTLLLALPVGVAATEAAKKDVDIDVRSNSTLNYGEPIVFFVHEKGNDTTPVTSGQLRIKLNDSSYGDYPGADGTVRIFLNANLVDQDVTVYVQYLGNDLWNETEEKTIQVHMNPQPLSTVTLTSAGYAYGAPVSGFSVKSATEHVSAGKVSIVNDTDTTFGEKAYKVRLQLTTEKGYSLASDVAVTLDDKTGTSTDDGYYEFQLDELYPTYTITYHLDGGTISGQPTSYNKYSGTVTIPNPTKDGYRFLGWTGEGITEPQKDISFAAKEMNQNLTYTAEWKEIIYHNVGFVTEHGATPQAQRVESGTKAARPADPTEDGWRFKGWHDYMDAPFDFDTPITGDTTLYAKWAKTWTVTFDANGYGTAPAVQTVEEGEKATKPADPTAEGYSFQGWYTTAECTEEFQFDTTPITGNTTVYAKWVKKPIVSFNTNGHGAALASQTVELNGKAVKPADPTAEGYVFRGWYTTAACTTEFDFNTPIAADTTLYAKWTQLFTLTFETNGGTKIDSVEAPDGSLVYLGSYKPTKSGYYFVGWYTDKNLTRASRVGYVRMDGNKTVYAKFAVADKTNPKTADPALPGLALAVLSFSTVGLAAMGLKKRK